MDYQKYPEGKDKQQEDQNPLYPAQSEIQKPAENIMQDNKTEYDRAAHIENEHFGTEPSISANSSKWDIRLIDEPNSEGDQPDIEKHQEDNSPGEPTTDSQPAPHPPQQESRNAPPIPSNDRQYGAPPVGPSPVRQNTAAYSNQPQWGRPVMPNIAVPATAPFLQKYGPRNILRSRAVNRMAWLAVAQTGFSYIWQIVVINILAIFGLELYHYSMDGETIFMELSYFWVIAIMVPLATLLPFVIYLAIRKPNLNKMVRFEHRDSINTVFCIVAGLGVCLFANIPANYVRMFFESFGYQSSSVMPSDFDIWECLLYFLGVAVLAAVVEEFVFRGIILSSLEKYGKGFALTVSALIFGLAHTDFVTVIFATIAGFAFGWMYLKTRNLWVPICVHFLNNSLAVAQSYSEYWFGDAASQFNQLTFLLPMLLGGICLIFLAIFRRKKFFTLAEAGDKVPVVEYYMGARYWNYPSNGGETIRAIVRAPSFWVMIGLSFITTLQYFF